MNWTFNFSINEHNRIVATLSNWENNDLKESDIDLCIMEGTYEIIKQSEKFAKQIIERTDAK